MPVRRHDGNKDGADTCNGNIRHDELGPIRKLDGDAIARLDSVELHPSGKCVRPCLQRLVVEIVDTVGDDTLRRSFADPVIDPRRQRVVRPISRSAKEFSRVSPVSVLDCRDPSNHYNLRATRSLRDVVKKIRQLGYQPLGRNASTRRFSCRSNDRLIGFSKSGRWRHALGRTPALRSRARVKAGKYQCRHKVNPESDGSSTEGVAATVK